MKRNKCTVVSVARTPLPIHVCSKSPWSNKAKHFKYLSDLELSNTAEDQRSLKFFVWIFSLGCLIECWKRNAPKNQCVSSSKSFNFIQIATPPHFWDSLLSNRIFLSSGEVLINYIQWKQWNAGKDICRRLC